MIAHVLFPLGVRLSTWLCAGAFVVLAVKRRDWRPLAAAVAWIWSFEVAFQIASIAADHQHVAVASRVGWMIIGVPVTIFIAGWVRPDLRLGAAAAVPFLIWVVTGFQVNGHEMVTFDPVAEVLNEAAKTLWAFAYLVPFLAWRFSPRRLGIATCIR